MTRIKKLAIVIGIATLTLFALTPERPASACFTIGTCSNHHIWFCCPPHGGCTMILC
jgi:hypothetical protein